MCTAVEERNIEAILAVVNSSWKGSENKALEKFISQVAC